MTLNPILKFPLRFDPRNPYDVVGMNHLGNPVAGKIHVFA
jgi:hypothetical protein